MADGLVPGFADPVRGAAESFRALLDAMARPGRIQPAGEGLAPPAPLSPAAAAAALTLIDADAPVWLPPALAGGPAEAFLRFNCSAPPAETPERAAFALGRWEDVAPALDGLPQGAPDYPDRAATLILEVAALTQEAGPRLTGPGIDGAARLDPGLPPAFWAARARTVFPLGLDVILCAGAALAALPRSTRAEL
jgi:alpha-D-ribose 1-methylphosphonate 5-triphosphate synthase subunit PhnH